MPKGFKGKYFSLAAITAVVSAVTLSAQETAVAQLEKVVVSASKYEEPIEEVTEDVTIITAEEIEERGLRTLDDLLRHLGGLDIVSNGGDGKTTSLYLRGLDNDKVLVLIDGVRYNDPSNFSGPALQHLLLKGVERVEIIKGPQSGLWGSDAAAGVINIVTTDRVKKVEGTVGSFVTRDFGATVSDASGPLFYSATMGYYKTDGFSAITPYNEDPTDYEADGYENRSARLGLGYRFDEGSIKASLHFIDADDEADLMTPDSKYDDTFLYRAYAIDANYQIDAHHITLHGDTTDTIRKFPDSAWGVKRFEGKTDMVELRDRFGYGVGSLQMGVGYQRYESDFERVDGVTGDVNYKDYYGYIVNKIRFGNLLLSQNIRYDDYDAFEDQWTGKIGMKYDFGPAALLANWGRAYNVPNQIEMLNPWGGVSNFDLDPEKTTGWDVGFKAGGWKVVYFKEKVKDLIVWENNQFVNKSGTSIFEGIEMSFKHAFTDNLYAQVGFTWLDPRDSEGKRLLRRAKTKYTYSFDWYPTERHTINLSGYFVGKRLDRDYQRGEIVETGSYNVTNLTASHRFAKNFTGYLQVRNLFDRRYQEAYNYGSAPRGFYAGIRASF